MATNGRIAVLCPTRDRVGGLAKLVDSVHETSTRATVIACIDDDTRYLYRQEPGSIYHYLARSSPAVKVNHLVQIETEYDVYGCLPDDSWITSPGWDEWMLDQIDRFPGRIGVVSARHNGGPSVNFPFVSRKWIDTLGWLACPDTHNYVWDTVLEILGDATRIVHDRPEFEVWHVNPNSKNVEPFVHDCVQFFGWCIGGRKEAICKLRSAM